MRNVVSRPERAAANVSLFYFTNGFTKQHQNQRGHNVSQRSALWFWCCFYLAMKTQEIIGELKALIDILEETLKKNRLIAKSRPDSLSISELSRLKLNLNSQ